MAKERLKVRDGKLYRFPMAARVTHWVYAGSWLVLFFTGLMLFTNAFDFMAPIFGGFVGAQIIHRIFAVIFLLPAVILLVIAPKTFAGWLRECFTWTSDDVRALPVFFKHLVGINAEMPPQGFLNAGEKLNSLLTIVFTILIVASGFVKWFPGAFSLGLVRWAYVMHSGSVALMAPVAIMHMFMGLANPGTKISIYGMLYGYVDAVYAKSHHEKWYDEVMMAGKD